MNQITKEQAVKMEWQGKPRSIKWAWTEYYHLRREGQSAEAHLALVSPYYSAVKRNPFLAPYRLLMACHHSLAVMRLDEYSGCYYGERSAAELNVLAAPFARMPAWVQKILWPLDDTLMRAHNLVAAAVSSSHLDNESGRTLPHDQALNLLLLARFKQKLGDRAVALEELVREALTLEPAILKEEDQKMAHRQLVRILFDAGSFYSEMGSRFSKKRRIFGVNICTIKGEELMYRAYELAQEWSPDQRRKIEKAM